MRNRHCTEDRHRVDTGIEALARSIKLSCLQLNWYTSAYFRLYSVQVFCISSDRCSPKISIYIYHGHLAGFEKFRDQPTN